MRYGYFHHDGVAGWVHVLAWLLPFLFIGAIVAVVVVLLTRDHRPGLLAATVDDGAYAALRLRYARGEITRDEYYETLRDLSHGPAPASWTPAAPATPPAPPASPEMRPETPPDA